MPFREAFRVKHPDGYIGAIDEACNNLGTGEWDLERFKSFLLELRQSVEEQGRVFQSIEVPQDKMVHARDALIQAGIGRDFWLRGVDKLIEFGETTDVDVLEVALDLCQQGHDNVERALRSLSHRRDALDSP